MVGGTYQDEVKLGKGADRGQTKELLLQIHEDVVSRAFIQASAQTELARLLAVSYRRSQNTYLS